MIWISNTWAIVAISLFKTSPNIYVATSLQKQLTAFSVKHFQKKSPLQIIDRASGDPKFMNFVAICECTYHVDPVFFCVYTWLFSPEII